MKTALVLIDLQNDYFPGGRMELEGAPEAVANAATVLVAARGAGVPVAHVRHLSVQPGATFFLPDTEGAEIHGSVAPLPGETVITKHFPNGFRDTHLQSFLRAQGAGRVAFAGMMTHMCVDATVRAAFDLGYQCLVAHDACATRALDWGGRTVPAPQVHAAFLAAMGAVYGLVLPAAEVAGGFKQCG